MNRAVLWLTLILASACGTSRAEATLPCRIEIVEKGTGWPVPLIELRTTHQTCFVSDNAGLIAFDSPELMGRLTWFEVIGHGYQVPADGFGMRGVRLTPKPGATLRIEVERTIIARRLGRITGGGLFAESDKLGLTSSWRDSGIFGCDSVQNAVHNGRLYWFWGDTTKADYPLGIFHGTGATTARQPLNALEPPVRLDLEYFVDENNLPRAIAKMPGEGPTWISGLISLPDAGGAHKLVCTYIKVKPPMEGYEQGTAIWNEDTNNFEKHAVLWTISEDVPKPPPAPDGHPVLWTDDQDREWVLYGNPFPFLRHRATLKAWQDRAAWEVLRPQELLKDAVSGGDVKPHSGSIAWNPWRRRWVTVFMEHFGKPSAFGELWYAEARMPTGPWGPAVKVLSHDNYTFYNPRLHAEFTASDSPILIFEGTYTSTFADHARPTPRYDYNQVLYRLDLDDPLLKAAQEWE